MPKANTDNKLAKRFENSHAFIIGINEYQHFSKLQTAVNDAQKIGEVLATQHAFRVYPPLLDATRKDIETLLTKTIKEKVGQKDRVFFYYAGHGIADDGDDGPAGYILPADASQSDVKTFVPMNLMHEALLSLPCRHVMLVLDCCFSGAFKWSSTRAGGVFRPKKIYQERFDRFIREPAWQVITSSAYDQKALDVLKTDKKALGDRGTDNDLEDHSPFARALIQGVSGEADAKVQDEGDGVITATELYAYIRDQVEPQTIGAGEQKRQTPGFFPLKKHDKGEFIFLHPRHRLNLEPIPRENPYRGLTAFEEKHHDLFFGRDRVISDLQSKVFVDGTTANEAAEGPTETDFSLLKRKMLVVAAASGAGKSSVVKAGLLPRLRREGFNILPVMRPGEHPTSALMKDLQGKGLLPEGAVENNGFSEAQLKHWQTQLEIKRTVLVIDQYEELITRCTDETERENFALLVKSLLDAAPENQFLLIITVRSDFEPQLDKGALQSYWQDGRVTVPWFTPEELREVVVMPTFQVVLIFDPPKIVDEIINEVSLSPGALPLLSYTLSELYEAYKSSGREDRALKADDYRQLGGVRGALRSRADEIYESELKFGYMIDEGSLNKLRESECPRILIEKLGKIVNKEFLGERTLREEIKSAMGYMVTTELWDKLVAEFAAEEISPEVVQKLTDAKDQHFPDELRFLDEMKQLLGSELLDQCQSILLNYAAVDEHYGKQVLSSAAKRELCSFSLTENDLQRLQKGETGSANSEKLQSLIGKKYNDASAFREALVLALGENTPKGDIDVILEICKKYDYRDTMRRIVLRLVSLEGGEMASRRALMDELDYGDEAENARVKKVIDLLVQSRLVTRGVDREKQQYVEPAHDALISAWGTLWKWVGEAGKDRLLLRGQVNNAARDWRDKEENEKYLWNSNPRLSLLRGDLDKTGRWFNAVENKFVKGSVRLKEKLDRRRRNIILSVILALTGLTVWALFEREEAIREANIAKANLLAIEAQKTLPKDNTRALRIAEAAYRTAENYPPASVSRIISDAYQGKLAGKSHYVDNMTHNSQVYWVDFSRDGQEWLTASGDALNGNVVGWNENGQVFELPKFNREVRWAVFAADENQVLTASGDSLTLWNRDGTVARRVPHQLSNMLPQLSADRQKILTISALDTLSMLNGNAEPLIQFPHGMAVKNARFLEDATPLKLLSVADSGYVYLWTEGGVCADTLAHSRDVIQAMFSPDGNQVLSISMDSTAWLWNIVAKQIVDTLVHPKRISHAVFYPDGRFATAGTDGSVKFWQSNGAFLKNLPESHTADITHLQISPDGNYLLTTSGDSTAGLWDDGGELVTRFKHNNEINHAIFSRDSKVVLTAAEDSTARRWHLPLSVFADSLNRHGTISHISISPTGNNFFLATHDGELFQYNQQEVLVDLPGRLESVTENALTKIVFSLNPASAWLLTVTEDDGLVRLWDHNGNVLDSSLHYDAVSAASFSGDASRVVIATEGGYAYDWQWQRGRKDSVAHDGEVYSAMYSHNAQYIVSAFEGNSVYIWGSDLKKADSLVHNGEVNMAVFSPDDKYILTACTDQNAYLWDVEDTKQPLDTLIHANNVMQAIYAADGKFILTISEKFARLWQADGLMLANLEHDDDVLQAVFSADKKGIYTITRQGRLHYWRTPDNIYQWLKTAPIYQLNKMEETALDIQR